MSQEEILSLEQKTFYIVSTEEFIKFRDMLHPDLFAFLTPHTLEDYGNKDTRLFLSQDFKSGFGVNPDGELISVFALERSRGKVLVREARAQGALYLCCMGDHLLNLYSEFGFSPVNILKWDNRFAPKNWNKERFGEPNLYEMRLVNPYSKEHD